MKQDDKSYSHLKENTASHLVVLMQPTAGNSKATMQDGMDT
jgi:hypothetical protein